ncbi:DUF1801 domain-containing protein [Flavobacterium amniphilum]|uniref:DUF1801 domain-containing protein n=1 Tax=Flavobacterium amniphilum TaxID=1834035 RepID=UPI002029C264|nr:DUF1801 domain-containing protein [Flavobacterium amniphilum]MCL9806589.1 DUF1801 domain-containing protein [Flavobacterium amniphilum]
MKPAEEYIINQPEVYQEIIFYLCDVVQQIVPEAQLLYKWKLPFFYIGKMPLCYINVVPKKKYVDLGFFYGKHLQLHPEFLTVEGRTLVKSLRYFGMDTIPDEVLRDLLKEAAVISS